MKDRKKRSKGGIEVLKILDLVREFYGHLISDTWPSQAAAIDFGITSWDHYAALQVAVRGQGVTMEQLQLARCRGPALTALIGPENPYFGIVFEASWDDFLPFLPFLPLSIAEIEGLSGEEFQALPEDDKRRYFAFMDRDNFPTAAEFYRYDLELGRGHDAHPAGFGPAEDGEGWTAEAKSCDGPAMPEPTPERRPNDQEPPGKPEKLDAEGLFGEVISGYSRQQAIEDGALVDVTETAKEAGFRVPVALTHAVWAEYVEVPEGVECQDEVGRLWDVVCMCRYGISQGKNRDASEVLYQLHVRNDNRQGEPPLVTLKATIGPGDDAKPCITVMLPDED